MAVPRDSSLYLLPFPDIEHKDDAIPGRARLLHNMYREDDNHTEKFQPVGTGPKITTLKLITLLSCNRSALVEGLLPGGNSNSKQLAKPSRGFSILYSTIG
jgi:hypothetical protein